ncbi:MAG: T9SS type A sorting domain-containing protein, partial [Bacteroidota bacterium]
LCTAPSDANTVYAATQQANGSGTGSNTVNHVFKTTDGGANWASVTTPTPTNAQAWYDLICTVDPNDPDDVMLGVAVRVYRSLDGGATWTNRAGSLHPDHHEILYRPGSSTEAVFGHDGGVDYSSTMSNAQPTYISRDNGYNVTQYYGGDLSPANASNVIVGGTQDNSTQYISASGIANATSPSPLSCCDGGFTIIDQDDANFAIGMIQFGASSRSFDGGQTYGPTVDTGGFFLGQNSSLFIAAMAFDDKEDLMYTTRGTNQMIRVSNIKDPNASPTLAGLTVPGLGSTASTFAPSPYAAPGVSTVFVGSTSGNVVRVDNAQTGTTPATTTITGTINAGNISSIDIGASENQLLVTVSNYGVNSVYETLDGGTTWTNKDSATLPDIPVRWALYNPNNRQQVILGTESGIWETLDINASPVTWTRAPGFPTVRVDQLQARTSDGRVTAITHGRGFFEATFSPAPLPVELTAFDAIAGPEGVDLSWTTATETDNAGFAVEVRGPDADTFEQVAFVGGAGTTAEPQAYRFRVESLDLGPHTFRLKQIDFDGQFEYSNEVETTVTPSTPFVLSAPYPNPAVERSTLEIGLAEAQDVRIAIFDVQGRRIRTVHDGELSANRTYRFGLEVSTLPAGTYLIRVAGPRLDETRRFTVIK